MNLSYKVAKRQNGACTSGEQYCIPLKEQSHLSRESKQIPRLNILPAAFVCFDLKFSVEDEKSAVKLTFFNFFTNLQLGVSLRRIVLQVARL